MQCNLNKVQNIFEKSKINIKKIKSMRDLRTEAQKARAERDEKICAMYSSLREQQPLVTRNRVLLAVAEEFGLVGQTVKMILRKHNAYN